MQTKVVRSAILAFVAGALAAACSSGQPAQPRGAPVLKKVYWVAGGAPVLVWTPPDEPSTFLKSSVPPFASEVDFVFDRRLDGDLIEDTVTIDGKVTTVPKAMPPIEVQWPGMADRPGVPPLKLRVAYNSTARFGDDTSYVFAKPEPQGFPSSETLMFLLHREALASNYGEPADAPEKIPVITEALTVGISVSPPPAATALKYQVPLVFSNRLAPMAGSTSPFIHLSAGGIADVPYKLLVDAGQASRWYLTPADCLGGSWPPGTSLTVTIDAGLPDAFGGTLAQSATATFFTSIGPTPPDASCTVALDAGASDAPADGGGADGGVPEGGAADGSVDGGALDRDAAVDAADAGLDAASGDAADGGAPDVPASFDADDAATADAADAPADAATET